MLLPCHVVVATWSVLAVRAERIHGEVRDRRCPLASAGRKHPATTAVSCRRADGWSKCKNLMSAQVTSKSGVAENPRESAARARSGLQLPSGLVRWVHSKLLRSAQDVQVLAADHRHTTAREVDVWRSVFVKEFAGRCSETRSVVKTRTEEPDAVARARSRSQTAVELERFDTVIEGTPRRNQTAWTLRNILRVSVPQGLNMGTIAPVPMKSKLVSFYNGQGALSRLIQERLSLGVGDRNFWPVRPDFGHTVWRNAGDCAGDGQSASAFPTSKAHQELSCSALHRLGTWSTPR